MPEFGRCDIFEGHLMLRLYSEDKVRTMLVHVVLNLKCTKSEKEKEKLICEESVKEDGKDVLPLELIQGTV